jgi:AcrR family transcriptional regulator
MTVTPVPVPGRPQQFSDDSLLDAALVVFDRDGYDGARMEAIATEAGTTRPTIHTRFGNKEQVYVAVAQREARRLGDRLIEHYRSGAGQPVAVQMENGVRGLFGFCAERPASFRLLFGSTTGAPGVDRDALVLRRVRQGILDQMLRHRSDRGLESNTDVELLAALMVAATMEAARYAIEGDSTNLDDAADLVIGFMTAGLLATDPDRLLPA